jgi:hypothetical protein
MRSYRRRDAIRPAHREEVRPARGDARGAGGRLLDAAPPADIHGPSAVRARFSALWALAARTAR